MQAIRRTAQFQQLKFRCHRENVISYLLTLFRTVAVNVAGTGGSHALAACQGLTVGHTGIIVELYQLALGLVVAIAGQQQVVAVFCRVAQGEVFLLGFDGVDNLVSTPVEIDFINHIFVLVLKCLVRQLPRRPHGGVSHRCSHLPS